MQNLNKIIRQFKLLGLVALFLFTLILVMNFKNIIKYIIGFIIGALLMFFISKVFMKPETKVICEQGYELRDTCIESTLLCTLTTQDSFSIYRIVREGLKKHDTTKPKVEEVVDLDVPYTKPIQKHKVTKYLNTGQTEVWDTITYIGEIVDWKRAHKANEIIEVQEKHTTTTAVIDDGKDESKTIQYIPTESASMYLGPSAGVLFDGNTKPLIGLNLQSKTGSVSLMTNPKSLKEWQLSINTKLIKVKK